ncbi:MAG TPA: PIN domain-containing protein [Solirubrobacteraceae bacterium]|nr:PIN domain-containing protein [Solirubrobacteraceae bacterium]
MIVPDSSVLVAALASHHAAHERAVDAVGDAPGLIIHVAFETSSVLSRMPEGQRMEATVVLDALEREFPEPWLALDRDAQCSCLRSAVDAGLRGGALYDALIAATAREHGATLLSADRRARDAYEAMGVDVAFLDS